VPSEQLVRAKVADARRIISISWRFIVVSLS
jgi:hypothetical protein